MEQQKEQSKTLSKTDFGPIKNDFINQSGLQKLIAEETFYKEISFALQSISQSEYLQMAARDNRYSVLQAVLNVAQVGLTLNPVRKYAYLIPKRVSGQWKAVLTPSYVGLCKLITDGGIVKSIQANLIYDGDEVKMDLAQNTLSHVPYVLTGKQKGGIRGAYSIARLNDGSSLIELMDIKEIEAIRDRSDSYKAFKAGRASSAIWETDFGEMCRKTVIKRHYKYLPKSINAEKSERAIAMDNEVNGFEDKPSLAQWQYATSLAQRYLSENEYDSFRVRIDTAETTSELSAIIDELQSRAPDPIDSGENYNQADISRKIAKNLEDERK